MKHFTISKRCVAFIAAALFATGAAADDFTGPYLGLALSGPGSIKATDRNGKPTDRDFSGISTRLYGGYRFDRHFALEAGYGNWGKHNLRNTGPGSSGDGSIEPSSLYVAGKAMLPVGERVDLFGKLGIVHTRIDMAGLGTPDIKINRALVGIGAEYRVTPKVGLTLELNRYGETRTPQSHFNINKLEAGVNFRF